MNTTPKPFTEEDIQLCAEAAHRALDKADDGWHYECLTADGDPPCPKAAAARAMLVEDVMPAVLRALADAGRLQPQPAREEWGIAPPGLGDEDTISYGGSELRARNASRVGGRVMRRIVTPWVEVGSTPEESRKDHE